jgi:hypothetical protein
MGRQGVQTKAELKYQMGGCYTVEAETGPLTVNGSMPDGIR